MVVVANVEDRIVVNDRNSESLEPTVPAKNIAIEIVVTRKIHSRLNAKAKTIDVNCVAKCIKAARRRPESFWKAALDFKAPLFSVLSLKNTIFRASVQFGK